jgi:ribonucleoside-triphosphate reductase
MDMHDVEELSVVKRDGKKVVYDRSRLERAVGAAFRDVYGEDPSLASVVEGIAEAVENILRGRRARKTDVEKIQDFVEQQIMASGYLDAAKAYVIFRHNKQQLRNLNNVPDASALADFLAISKYARYLPDKQRRETWNEAVLRVENMHVRRFPEMKDVIKRAFDHVRGRRGLASGRHMQFAGEAIEANHARGYNCAAALLDKLDIFQKTMFLLLSGSGVGLDICFENVEKLPSLAREIDESKVKHYTIPDTIEGWSDAVGELIQSYIEGYLVEFNYSEIRRKGSPLKTSGGRAPGHVPLRKALENMRGVLHKCLGRKLKPIECFDLVAHIAGAVLAGGVRRSALLMLFSPDDGEMMNSKTGDWHITNPQRARANISVRLNRTEVRKGQLRRIISRMKEFGEPGFIFCDDPDLMVNPCGESVINIRADNGETGFGFCNLTTVNGSVMRSEREFKAAVHSEVVIGTIQASYTDFPYLGEVTESIVRRDALLGVSITGIMDNPALCLDPEIQKRMAEYAVEVNKEVAAQIGINPAKRVCLVKPEGTGSKVLMSVSAGITPRWARRYFNRIQCNRSEAPYRHFHKSNPHMCEPSVWGDQDDILTFCIQSPDSALTWDDLSALEMLENVRLTQTGWVRHGATEGEHSVSNTILVEDHEWDDVAEYIWKHKEDLVGVTLLPRDPGRYQQAPLQSVETEEDELKWNHIIENYTAVDYTEMVETEDGTVLNQTVECDGATCVLK